MKNKTSSFYEAIDLLISIEKEHRTLKKDYKELEESFDYLHSAFYGVAKAAGFKSYSPESPAWDEDSQPLELHVEFLKDCYDERDK